MKKVLLSKSIHPQAMKVLEGKVQCLPLPDSTAETARKMLADVDGVILRTNIQLTRELICAAPACRIISRTGVGVDNVDVAAATEKGIMVCNTPGVNTISVAEHTVALILGLAKTLPAFDAAVRAGNWKIRNANGAVDLEGKTLGLVGVGKIGAEVARKCRLAFGMRVIAFDPLVERVEGVGMRPAIEEVFREADVLSLHVPFTKETHHLVDARLIGLMKADAFLINTSRGAVVDETALAQALRERKIGGAGLDVMEEEPPAAAHPFFGLANLILTPHAAALSRECEMKVAIEAARAIVDFAEGREPEHVFNRAQLARG
jgi:D-3-phosphoglycerate dehydrogenase / 2-oxoglutarate reductase